MLRDWSTSTTYASLDTNGDPALNGPVELQAGGTIAPAGATVTGMNDAEVMHIDVTSIVENWRSGQPNHGFYIGTAGPENGGTDNGWQVFTTGAGGVSFRPELRIIGIRVPEPASAMMGLGGLLLLAVARRRR
jgi:MYXO-CTERM domain-containing protein